MIPDFYSKIINQLYINKRADWILDLDDNEIEPYLIQRTLMKNDALRVQVRWLDKYVFVLPPKMFLSLAWSVIPKVDRAPFIENIKKQESIEKFDFIFSKVRKHFKLSDNDFNAIKERLRESIKNDLANWFSYYGVEKVYWKEYSINFNLIKDFGRESKQTSPGYDLSKWGL
jgi:hypothetical protein